MAACPRCGAELTPDAPQGLCPRCLVQASFDSNPSGEPIEITEEPAAAPAVAKHISPPAPAELAAHFPQLEIQELLGYGGMGAVYKARQTKLDRAVALKIIRPESAEAPAFAERFNREARMLARLNHPQIVAVHDFGEVTGDESAADGSGPTKLYYFLMEYVDGADLRRLMNDGHVNPEQALAIISQICEALQFAHSEGIVHRDIKPENILLDRYGRVKIADFGLAKLALRSDQDFTLTATHQIVGTLRYMSPEQMAGSDTVDHRADIYSLGVVFYEMLTGEVPMGQFEPPSNVAPIDARLDEVVMRSLAREPERRFQQAADVKSSLDLISTPAGNPTQAQIRQGVSTVMENHLAGAWRWITEPPARSASRSSMLAAILSLLTFLLALAGCGLVLMPWVNVTIPDFGKSYVVLGSETWAGIISTCLFLGLSLVVVAIPRNHRWALNWNIIKTILAGLALLFAFQFPYSVENTYVSLRNDPNRRDVVNPATDSKQAPMDQFGQRALRPSLGTYFGRLKGVHHQTIHTPYFYAVLGIGIAALIFCGLGIRSALNAKSTAITPIQSNSSPTPGTYSPAIMDSPTQFQSRDANSHTMAPPQHIGSEDWSIPHPRGSRPTGDGHYLKFILLFFFLCFAFVISFFLVAG